MTTGSKRWWRAVAVAAVTGGVIGGWFGLARPQPAKADKSHDETAWTRSPAVTDVARAPEAAPPTDAVTPVGGTLPIPVPGVSGPVVPAVPGSQPILVPAAPLFVPSPGLPVIEPVAISSEAPSTARNAPKCRCRSSTTIIFSPVPALCLCGILIGFGKTWPGAQTPGQTSDQLRLNGT